MDKTVKDFLLRDDLERHLESMSNAVNGIDPRQALDILSKCLSKSSLNKKSLTVLSIIN